MNRSAFAILSALLLTITASPLFAQASGSSGGVNVAVIDIKHIFDNHQKFKQRMDEIQNEVKAFDTQMQAEAKQMRSKQEQLQGLNTSSPEYSKLEGEIAQTVGNMKVKQGLKKKQILDKEAKIYVETYQDIVAAVSAFANQHQIGLVLRYDSSDIDPNNRNEVLQGVNRAVVYQSQIDITYPILNSLNGGNKR